MFGSSLPAVLQTASLVVKPKYPQNAFAKMADRHTGEILRVRGNLLLSDVQRVAPNITAPQ